ncbi:hypothetical protein JW933_10415 [candidate division FCPU426 bacterium]|nr:hypothetical protein [candidate division FCPU426 bacterium]
MRYLNHILSTGLLVLTCLFITCTNVQAQADGLGEMNETPELDMPAFPGQEQPALETNSTDGQAGKNVKLEALFQETYERQIPDNCGYLGLGARMQTMCGQTALFGLVRGGWQFDSTYLGANVSFLLNPRNLLPLTPDNAATHMIYGGFEGGYIQKIIPGLAVRFNLLMGLTSIFYFVYDQQGVKHISANDTLLLEPGIVLLVDPFGLSWLNITASIDYHLTFGAEEGESYDDGDLSNVGLGLGLQIIGF